MTHLLDLSVTAPRGLDVELEGYAWLPRMLDKARATLAGTNGSYLFGCPIDHTCLARLGVSAEVFLDLVRRNSADIEVLRALQQHGIPTAPQAWFDAPAVEDAIQRSGCYLRTEPSPPPGGLTLEIDPGYRQPPAMSSDGLILSVREGNITVFLGDYQARTVGTGEAVIVPAGIEWQFQNTGTEPAALRQVRLIDPTRLPAGAQPS